MGEKTKYPELREDVRMLKEKLEPILEEFETKTGLRPVGIRMEWGQTMVDDRRIFAYKPKVTFSFDGSDFQM